MPTLQEMHGDGICHICGKKRDVGQSTKYAGDNAERDPFCSASCAREYHGVVLESSTSVLG